MSAWGPLIYAGCFAATLSSAIACMFGAPRVFQAVAKDKLYPGVNWINWSKGLFDILCSKCHNLISKKSLILGLYIFAKGNGPNNDPFRGYVLVFLIAGTCILIGDLNQVNLRLSSWEKAIFKGFKFQVSSVLSNFYVAAYALINFSVFHAGITKSPGKSHMKSVFKEQCC